MRVLIIGSGGREHALYWSISQSFHVSSVLVAPGNGGIPEDNRHDVDELDSGAILKLAQDEFVDLVVIGPEEPLADGLADMLREKRILVFGPSAKAARLESSKVFMKKVCEEARIKTAPWHVASTYAEAQEIINSWGEPLVVKADGLCGGKGVVVAETEMKALTAAYQMLVEKKFGEAGSKIVIEERLEGRECSVMALCDGVNAVLLPPARDYKQLYPGGPNTGGMGAYSPLPDVSDELLQEMKREIILPTLRAMIARGTPFHGLLYAGIMLTANGPYLLEYNVRFGDPETQAILPRLEDDIFPYLYATCEPGGLSSLPSFRVKPNYTVCTVLVSGGYPEVCDTGFPISGLKDDSADALVFHAGTEWRNGSLVTFGGRVLSVVGVGSTLEEAAQRSQEIAESVSFEGKYFRRDIGVV